MPGRHHPGIIEARIMTLSDNRFISDELLSAYLDGAVTPQERQAIEAAVAQDGDIAWRLESLRQTVTLLQALPDVPLPRSFALTLDQVRWEPTEQTAPATQPAALRPAHAARPQTHGPWSRWLAGWRDFWSAGNLTLRNAAAVSFALFLTLMVSGAVTNLGRMAPVGTLATVPMSAPAAAPAEEADVVAMIAPAERSAPSASERAAEESATEESVADAPVAAAALEEPAEAPAAKESPGQESEPSAVTAGVPDNGPDEQADDGTVAMLDAPELGAPPVVGPMADPASPGVLFPPGGMGSGGDGTGPGMGGDMGNGGGDARLLPPEAYLGAPEDLIVIEPTPMVEASAAALAGEPGDEPGAADAGAPAVAAMSVEAESAMADSPTEQVEATPAAVAMLQPQPTAQPESERMVTSSDEPDAEEISLVGYGVGLPLLGIAQAGGAFLTLVLASLWWRSRDRRHARRP